MAEWDFAQWLKFGGTWLAIFAFVGGIIAQTSGGVSGAGFREGMWKGVEVFFVVLAIIGVGIGAFAVIAMVSNSVNSSL